jgi:predicted ribosomally synthesized peptide with SipW-like signal peptide
MKSKRLLVGVLVIAVVIAAVTGGTYAIFTDTEAVHVKFEAGTIDIEVAGVDEDGYAEFFLNPETFEDWKPGDYAEWELDIHNSGTNVAWINIYVYPTGHWDDGHPDLWTCETNPDCKPYYEWEELENPSGSDWNMWLLDHSQHLRYKLKVYFPQCAGNSCQGAQGDLLILVEAKQWRNKYPDPWGYSCVALEDKDPLNNHLPDLSNGLEGIICYKPTGNTGELDVVLNAYGLTPDAYYQLDLAGGDSNNPHDGACTAQDDALAGMMPGDLYSSGYWNWGTVLEATCNSASGGEGVWNYAGVYGDVQADASGSISYQATLTGLPTGNYVGVGAHVKEITGTPPGTGWTVILSEMDYLSFNVP